MEGKDGDGNGRKRGAWTWIRENLVGRKRLLVLSVVVGALSGLMAYLLKSLIELIHGTVMPGAEDGAFNWSYLVYPSVGILITALFIKYVVRDDIGHGVTKILFAIARRQGHIRRHNCWSSVAASSVTIGMGGSVGAESPAVLTGAAIGSTLGEWFKVDQKTLFILIGCGATGAVAGIFKAPFAGLLFTLEVLMIDLTMASLMPLLLSSVTATLVTFCFTGQETMFSLDEEMVFTLGSVVPTVWLGVGCGVVAIYFTWMAGKLEDFFGRMRGLVPKFVVGSVMLGASILLLPPLYGEGYDTIQTLINGEGTDLLRDSFFENQGGGLLLMLGLIILVKVFATTATTSGGGCGGLFAPSLFLGCVCGYAFGMVWETVGGGTTIGLAGFALLGMAGMMTGVMHSPLTSIFLIAELTGGYTLLVPLMVVTTVTYLTITVGAANPHSIYAQRLAKKGQLVTHNRDKAILTLMSMDGVIDRYCMRIAPETELGRMVMLIGKEKADVFPVVDRGEHLLGLIELKELRNVIFRQELYRSFNARGLMKKPVCVVHKGDAMVQVMELFRSKNVEAIPVLDESERFVGMVYKEKLYATYQQMQADFAEE